MAQAQTPGRTLSKPMDLDGLMDITARMNNLIALEAAMLDAQRYADIATLHDEKLDLAAQLEAYQQTLAAGPDWLKNADINVREELLLRADDLAFGAQENFKKIAAARAVNQRVLQAIRDVLTEDHSPTTYGRNGSTSQNETLTLSMNLNQKA